MTNALTTTTSYLYAFRRAFLPVCAILFAGAMPRPAVAQGAQSAATVAELRQRLDEIERTMQMQVAAVREEIARLEGTSPPQSQPPTTPLVSETAQAPTFGRDRESVARVNNQPLDPALVGFVAIPGTPARVKIDGYAKLDTNVDGKPAGNSDLFLPSSIPVGLTDAQQVMSTTMHIRQTRLNVDFRSPTQLGGDLRTYAEVDLFGPNGAPDPRMRHFYGQVMNVLIGHTWTTFTDIDALPDTLNLSGPTGISLLRQAQVRYTQPLAGRQSLAVAIERPQTQAPQITDTGAAYNPAPDIVARYRLDRDRSHLQVASVVRMLGYRIAARNETTVGAGVNVSGAWKASANDLFMASMAFGSGIARYIDNLAGQNADLDRNDANNDVTALPTLAGYAAYTRQLPKRFRTTAIAGYSGIDNTEGQSASAFRDSKYFSANLLWNPAGSLDVGFEYFLGTHRLNSGEDAHASRLQFSAKYDFFRKRQVEP